MSLLREKLFAAKRASSAKQHAHQQFSREDEQWHLFDAKVETTEAGSFIRRTVTYAWNTPFGDHTLSELQEQASRLSVLGAGSTASNHLLFIDTETTGLGVGTGNVPFMIGMAYSTDEGLMIDQCFMRNPAEERPMLEHLQSLLNERSCLITYNGKSFDWPVLKNRFVLNRMKQTADRSDPIHLDFLHPSRSLWKHILPSCRLGTVEEERLGIERHDDVPGSLAPTLYFRFLQEKKAELVRGVFEHNEKDLVSLAVLAIHFGKLLAGQFDPDEMGAEELYRLGLWLERNGSIDLSEKIFQRLLQRQGSNMPYYWERLAERFKKSHHWEQAVELWKKCVQFEQQKQIVSIVPYVELAKYYEHRNKNISKAIEYAEQALEHMERQFMFSRKKEQVRKEKQLLLHRLSRLKQKQEKRTLSEEVHDHFFDGNLLV